MGKEISIMTSLINQKMFSLACFFECSMITTFNAQYSSLSDEECHLDPVSPCLLLTFPSTDWSTVQVSDVSQVELLWISGRDQFCVYVWGKAGRATTRKNAILK